jgi:hypothetical protein
MHHRWNTESALRRLRHREDWLSASAQRPWPQRDSLNALSADYQRYGEQCVKEGRYSEVIRYHDHLRPAAMAIAAALG